MKNLVIINGPSSDDLFDSLHFYNKNRARFVVRLEGDEKEKIEAEIIAIAVAHRNDGRLDEGITILDMDRGYLLPHRRHKWTIKMFIRERYNIKVSVIPSDEWIEYEANYSTKTKKGVILIPENPKRNF